MIVRRVRERWEIGPLIWLGEQQVRETLPHLPFDRAVVEHYAQWMLDQRDPASWRAWIAWDDDAPIGFLFGTSRPYLFCRGDCVSQEMLYVIPSRRGGTAAARLLAELDTWADEIGALEVFTGIANGQPHAERFARALERRGHERVGSVHRRITTCATSPASPCG